MIFFSKPRYELLDEYVSNGDYDKALKAIALEMRKKPESFSHLMAKAEILSNAADRDAAIRIFRKLGQDFARERLFVKSILLYKQILRLRPDFERAEGELASFIERHREIDPAGAAALTPLPEIKELDSEREEDTPADEDWGWTDVGDDDEWGDMFDVMDGAAQDAPTPGLPALSQADPARAKAAAPHKEAERIPDNPYATTIDPELARVKEMESSAMFTLFGEGVLEKLLRSTAMRRYTEGDIIVTEGEPGLSMFLIASGSVKVFTRGQLGEHIHLANLATGDFFGEMSLLTGKPRNATITASSLVFCIEVSRSGLNDIAAEHPEVFPLLQRFHSERALATATAVISSKRILES